MEEITEALAAIEAGGEFAVELGLAAEALRVVVQGVGPLRFPIPAEMAKQLGDAAEPAPYGRRSETVHDARVRDTGQIERDRIKIDTRRLRRALAPALGTIRERLGMPEGVELAVVLDKLLVYGPGQFFATHQDSEREDAMVGTLVMTLPCSHEGGAIVVEHRGEKRSFGGGRAATEVSLLAFYADCRHEVRPVRSGHRIALTYHLLRRGEATERPQIRAAAVEELVASVASHFSTPVPPRYGRGTPQRPDRLVYLLDHEYSQKSLGWDNLKNGDRLRAAALREVAGRLDCAVFLTLADVHQIWDCEDESYGYHRRGRRYLDDERGEGDHKLVDLIDEDVELRHWIDTDGRVEPDLAVTPTNQEICFTRPSVEMDPFESEYEGYMGNSGNTMERWYHRAAIVMWPRARGFVIRAKMAPAWAVDVLAALVKTGAVDEARGRARELVPFWKEVAPAVEGAAFVPRLLKALVGIAEAEPALELLAPLGPHRLGERALPTFVALVERHGLAWGQRLFTAWAQAVRHDTPPWRASLPRLCEALTAAGGEHGRGLASWLLAREVDVFRQRRVEEGGGRAAFAEELAERHLGDIAALLAAAVVIPAPALRDELVGVLVAPATGLPLATAGVLLRKLCEGRTPTEVQALGLQALVGHVVGALAAALAAPERDPNDWTIEPPTGCACELCQELAVFLRDREQRRCGWRLAKERRQHVHHRIDLNRLPVTHETIRQGSPYTLVLTKQAALFERAAAKRAAYVELLAWLEGSRGVFVAGPAPGPKPKRGRSAA